MIPKGQIIVSLRKHNVELLIVDEADRLSNTGLEYLRDLFDRKGIGLILIGMPGIEKRMERYAQLFSRVGFAHQYRPLQDEELTFVLTRRWRDLGLAMDEADFTDAQPAGYLLVCNQNHFIMGIKEAQAQGLGMQVRVLRGRKASRKKLECRNACRKRSEAVCRKRRLGTGGQRNGKISSATAA